MARGGARPGAGRTAADHPDVPLLTCSFTVRLTDLGVLNRLGRGNLSLGPRRLIDLARAHHLPDVPPTATLSSERPTAAPTIGHGKEATGDR
jgi:hypothetical protein